MSIWANGSRYEGDFKKGKPHGKGIFVWGSETKWAGDRYDGDWKDGKRTGRGVTVWASGNRYEGDYKDNMITGHGTKVWTSGGKYEGQWKDTKRHGRGVYVFATGARCKGNWRNGNLSGTGKGFKHGKNVECYRDGNKIKFTSHARRPQEKVPLVKLDGDLVPIDQVPCISTNRMSNKNDPILLHVSALKCRRHGKLNQAIPLHLMGQLFSMFDIKRVSDKSAHQAALYIQLIFARLNTAERKILKREIDKFRDPTTAKGKTFCRNVQRIGPPTYYPAYMINHGMGPLIADMSKKPRLSGLSPDYNAEKNWLEVLNKSTRCNASI